MVSTVMTDNFLAALIVLTALAWTRFYRRRSWGSCLLFAALAAASALTKGTALGLAFLPVIYLALRRDLGFLFNPKTLVAGILIAIPVLPWYAATYKMAADGFIYSWGLSYTRLAVPYFARALVHELGLPVVAAYAYGLYLCATRPEPEGKLDVASFAAISLSMIVFPMLAPADLTSRYIIPAIPSLAVVAVWALYQLVERVLSQKAPGQRLRPVMVGAVVLVSVAMAFGPPHLEPFHTERLASHILDARKANPLVLVSGDAVVEGAVIATFAQTDFAMKYYVVRGTQVLGSGNFVGTEYNERFPSDADMAKWIKDNKIGWIIVDDSQLSKSVPSNARLLSVIKSGALGSTMESSVQHRHWLGGTLLLYRLPDADAVPERSLDVFTSLKPSHGGF
jgi:4-amino-4-deoxy-L-arabinose transferase-like glycosyltransferase